jgi:hypothetical protein
VGVVIGALASSDATAATPAAHRGIPVSSFADNLFAEMGVPVLKEYVGEESEGAYLTPRGGTRAGPFDVILEHVATQRTENGSGRTLEHVQIAKFPKQEGLPFWTGTTLVGMTVTIGDVDWAFDLVEALSDSMAVVRLTRRGTSEVSRPGFRRT